MQAIRALPRGCRISRGDAEARKVFALRCWVVNGLKFTKLYDFEGFCVNLGIVIDRLPQFSPRRKIVGRGVAGEGRRMINMPNQLTGDFLHYKG
jgi:hypothetical protein